MGKEISYKEIARLTLSDDHYSQREIATAANCSPGTVSNVQRRLEAAKIDAATAADLTERELRGLLNSEKGRREGDEYKQPDWARIADEMARDRKLKLIVLWEEYAEEAVLEGKRPYMYSFFSELFRRWVNFNIPTLTRSHVPGDKMEVDWAGDTMELVDPFTGVVSKVYLFVATLPYSQYTFVMPTLSMDAESWIDANVAALRFFGGVPRIVVCDNLKTGVIRNSGSDVVLNRSYREFGEHYGTAIIPTGVGKPKQKPSVEGSVGKIGERIIKMLRHRRFLDFDDLREAVSEKLAELNSRPFDKRRDGSRASVFEDKEKQALSPLPTADYEMAEWAVRTVGRDYMVSVSGSAYSVPYEYIKQKVDVRIGRKTVEIFFDGDRIATHARSFAKGDVVVCQSHRPQWHVEYLSRSGDSYRERALLDIGASARRVVDSILSAGREEDEGYRACAALLRLADKYGAEAVEEACERACGITKSPSLKAVKILLRKKPDRDEAEDIIASYAIMREEGYYARADVTNRKHQEEK